MASHINSALVDLEYLCDSDSYPYELYFWRPSQKFKYLIIFHLCARKWGSDDASLGSLLLSIEDLVSKIAPEIHHLRLISEDDESNVPAEEVFRVKRAVEDAISSCEEMMNQWYNNFSNCSRLSWCSQDRDDEFLDFFNTILEAGYSISTKNCDNWALVHQLEALQEALIFLKNFIRFTTLQTRQNLLTHIKVVALSAAYIFYLWHSGISNDDRISGLQQKMSGLLQKIKPVDPRVCETYIQALNDSEFSRQSQTATLDGDVLISEGFIGSLLFYLFEVLKADSLPNFSTKDQLLILDEGLRSLRSILKKQPKSLSDEKMWDLTGMVRDAGVVIFSLFLDAIEDGLAKEMDVLLFDLLNRINLVREKFTESGKSPQGSMFNHPKADDLRFIDFLLESLTEQTNCEAGSRALSKQQIQTIHEELMVLRPFLDKILELRSEKEELQGLWNRVVELAYKVEFLIEDVPQYSSPMSFDSITEEIKIIKLDALEIFDKEGLDFRMKKVTEKFSYFSTERSMSIIKDDVVGLNDEATLVKNRLTRGASRLQIVAIVGMPGSGKTTLAKLVYNDSSIMEHFRIRAWCCVSQLYDKKSLLLEILGCIPSHELPSGYSKEPDEEDLALQLYKTLKRKSFLIVLDDMWDIGAWNNLKDSFPDDANKSRIILTSRNVDFVLENKLDLEPLFLCELNDDESQKLLKAKLFPQDDWPPTLYNLCTKVVERCKGLPLTIVIVAGILATMEQDNWKEFVEGLSSSNTSILDECKNMLELSYSYLPDKVKSCLLYFGVFPEDYEHSTNELTWLWIAEGFVPKTQSGLESEAKDCLMHLINRNLVMIGKHNSTGRIKTCHIHDLLHVFCVEKAKEENFFQFFQGFNELSSFNETQKVRRLCIHPKMIEDFRKSRLFYPRLRCMLFFKSNGIWENDWFIPFCFRTFKLVRVLDMSAIFLDGGFTDEIEMLFQLRYLAVKLDCDSIPSSIANLSNLETFIVYADNKVELPNSIGNLKKLRHVKIKSKRGGTFCLDTANIENSLEVLGNLKTFSTLTLCWKDMEKTIKKFPNIQKLTVILSDTGKIWGSKKIRVLESLSWLESLIVRPDFYLCSVWNLSVEFSFPLNLRKLTLSGLRWQWCKILEIGNLPNLEVLKLSDRAFVGEDWNMGEAEGQFPKLCFLGLNSLDIVRWTASESVQDHFPQLVKLVLHSCLKLKEIPACLGDIPKLEMIEASYCLDSVINSIREIEEEQKSMGNENLKVVIDASTIYRKKN